MPSAAAAAIFAVAAAGSIDAGPQIQVQRQALADSYAGVCQQNTGETLTHPCAPGVDVS